MKSIHLRQRQGRAFPRPSSVFLCLALLCVCLFCCSRAQADSFTLMVYMTGSDLESQGGAATADLNEMTEYIPENGDVRVVVLASGSRSWEAPVDTESISVYEIGRGGMTPVREGPLRSMGDPGTLADFLTWAKEQYPADRYGLILWDHGGGPLLGVCFDELFQEQDERDCLTLDELASALEASPFAAEKLTFIGFDACLMGSIEVAMTVSPFAEYMIASQEPEPPSGWHYSFLPVLAEAEDGAAIGQKVVETFGQSMADVVKPVTLSCLDLSKCGEIAREMDRFFSAAEPLVTEETYADYAECRALSKALGTTTSSNYDLVDLIDLISLYGTYDLADGSALIEKLQEMVTAHYEKNDEYVNGVSIYNPFDNKSRYVSPWGTLYPDLAPAEGYRSFVAAMAGFSMGKPLMKWNSEYQAEMQELEGSVQLSVDLTGEEIRNTTRTRMFVVEKKDSGDYQMIWYDNQNVEKAENALRARYDGQALYEVDGDGEILNGPLTFLPAENGFVLYGILYFDVDYSGIVNYGESMKVVKLLYQYDEAGQPVFSEILTENEGMYLPSSIRLEECLELWVFNSGPQISEDGKMTLVYDVQNPANLRISSGAPQLAVLPVQDRNERLACLAWTDFQDHSVFSEFVSVPNPTLYNARFDPAETGDERITAAAGSVEIVTGYDAGIRCTLDAENRTEEGLLLTVTEVAVNGKAMTGLSGDTWRINSGKAEGIPVFIDSGVIRMNGFEEIRKILVRFRVRYDNGDMQYYNLEIPVWINSSIFLE